MVCWEKKSLKKNHIYIILPYKWSNWEGGQVWTKRDLIHLENKFKIKGLVLTVGAPRDLKIWMNSSIGIK